MEDARIKELKQKIEKLEREIHKTKGEEVTEKKHVVKFVPLKTLYKWEAPSRIYVERNRLWFLKIAVVALLLILLFAFLQDLMVILVICIAVLVIYLLGSIPPRIALHEINNKGIDSIGQLYKWEDLKDFWVALKLGKKVVYVSTKLRFPSRLVMLVRPKDEPRVVRLLFTFLKYKEFKEKQGWLTKRADGVMIDPERYLKGTEHVEKTKSSIPQRKSSKK